MPSSLRIRVVLAFVLAIVTFCTSTLYSSYISRAIDRGALSIANDAIPAIEALSTIRAERRRLESALGHYAMSRSAADRDEVLSTRATMEQSFERYLAVPAPNSADRALRSELHGRLAMVDSNVDTALARVGTVPPPVLLEGIKPAMDAATQTLRAAFDANATRARQLALRIEAGRQRATRVALLLDLLSTLFTVAGAVLTLRALAHHHRVVEERNRLVAERAAELEQFAGRVAHDVLGPLSATRLAVGHATKQVGDGALRRMLERGLRGVERVNTIVDGLLQFARAGARPQPGVVTVVAPMLEALVAELEPAAAQRDVTLRLEPVPLCSIHGNAGVLSSVVENLVRNAIKYMGERAVRQVTVRVLAGGELVRFEVTDTGPGIAPTLMATVFDPHVRGADTRQPGIGLGLATVKRIVEAHGGRVGVESRLGEGSRFWCELPRADVLDDHPRDHGSQLEPSHSAESV
jgi:signal transduction histidine kinase